MEVLFNVENMFTWQETDREALTSTRHVLKLSGVNTEVY